MVFLDHLLDRGHITQDCHADLLQWSKHARIPLGMLAVRHGLLNGEDIDNILSAQRSSAKFFGELAVEMSLLSETQVQVLLDIQSFQMACAIAQAVALSGAMSLPTVLGELCDFISRCPERVLEQSCNTVGK